ncbi:Rieske (2Fe-2S) protein [Halomonas organivorans]|uniref:Nitrite reductase/ring-hydroxylating ferredoxin subunit n=1 Tax=Halomonas organivorans TaxID=257772 RepID=A0A7W5G7G5_9GAMM|nr:Rieske 2Fe-2S domain-containing protein [Halomonas organivorans]MBB3143254.1 nitrite reductase/ring-hydroxylating ferredoxin subunit [Halomonas organivorans]
MTAAWQQYRSAPDPGTRVVAADALPERGHLSLILESERGRFPLLVARLADNALVAYVNACPHQYLPLDQRGDRLLSEDGETLRCTNHDAAFATRTGEGVGGLGLGCALDAVPVRLEDGWLVIDK